MKFPLLIKNNKPLTHLLIILVSIIVIIAIVRIFIHNSEIKISILSSVYHKYLSGSEWIANSIFKWLNAGVVIDKHKFIFDNHGIYMQARNFYFEDWTRILLFRKWSIISILTIWIVVAPFRRKLIFSILFLFTHFLSVISGLLLLGFAGPKLFYIYPDLLLSPTFIGTFLIIIFISIWLKINVVEIQSTLTKYRVNISVSDKVVNELIIVLFFLILFRSFIRASFLVGIFLFYIIFSFWFRKRKDTINLLFKKSGINASLSYRRINEILIIGFIFLLLQSIFLPNFEFKPFVLFLLSITRWIVMVFGYEAHISGDLLYGLSGSLWLGNHCLGLMSMLLFASGIYLTRIENNIKTWLYIFVGLCLILILNIARLVLVFIVAQGENGIIDASNQHQIFNIIIHVMIFVLWIIWYELILKNNTKVKCQ